MHTLYISRKLLFILHIKYYYIHYVNLGLKGTVAKMAFFLIQTYLGKKRGSKICLCDSIINRNMPYFNIFCRLAYSSDTHGAYIFFKDY
jgi:hypothetical protein